MPHQHDDDDAILVIATRSTLRQTSTVHCVSELVEKYTIERWGMAYRVDVRQQSYPGPCSSHLVESCIHSAFYGTIWTVVFNDSKVFTQLGNMPSERVMASLARRRRRSSAYHAF